MRIAITLALSFGLASTGFSATNVVVVKTTKGHSLLQSDALWSDDFSDLKKEITNITPAFESMWDSATSFPAEDYQIVHLRHSENRNAVIAQLKRLSNVVSAEPDFELSDPGKFSPNDPRVKNQWYLDDLTVSQAWETTRGDGAWVADVESGFETSHPDLKNQFDFEKTFDYDPKTKDPKNVNDNKRSHGTPVCGIIGAEGDNNIFGVGIAPNARLIGSQMADSWEAHSTESVWTVNVARAILGSVQRGASVVLIEKQVPSTNGSIESVQVMYDAVKAAVQAGVPVVVPGGNFSSELRKEASQADSGAIFVGATNRDRTAAGFSNYGTRLNVAAPGDQVYSTQENGGETFDFGGTSSASAITAGIVALVRSANPRLSPLEVRDVLVETGLNVSSEEFYTGVDGALLNWGPGKYVGKYLQANAAVLKASQLR